MGSNCPDLVNVENINHSGLDPFLFTQLVNLNLNLFALYFSSFSYPNLTLF